MGESLEIRHTSPKRMQVQEYDFGFRVPGFHNLYEVPGFDRVVRLLLPETRNPKIEYYVPYNRGRFVVREGRGNIIRGGQHVDLHPGGSGFL